MSDETVELPDTELLRIFNYCSPRDLCSLARTCKRWQIWAEDKSLWKKFLQPTVIPTSQCSYKRLFLFSQQYRLAQYRVQNSEADRLLNNYMPLDKDKLIEFLTKYPMRINFILFHPNPDIIRVIDNIVLTHIAKIDRSKIMTMVQHLDTRISTHLNRHLLMHFMDRYPESVPHVLNHPHDAVITEINDKLLIKALEIDVRCKTLILEHSHPHIVRLRQAQVVQARLVETHADTGCRIS